MFSSQMHGDTETQQRILVELDAIDDTPMFQARYHATMASDDFEKRGNQERFPETGWCIQYVWCAYRQNDKMAEKCTE